MAERSYRDGRGQREHTSFQCRSKRCRSLYDCHTGPCLVPGWLPKSQRLVWYRRHRNDVVGPATAL